jgi:hypothetical protein
MNPSVEWNPSRSAVRKFLLFKDRRIRDASWRVLTLPRKETKRTGKIRKKTRFLCREMEGAKRARKGKEEFFLGTDPAAFIEVPEFAKLCPTIFS